MALPYLYINVGPFPRLPRVVTDYYAPPADKPRARPRARCSDHCPLCSAAPLYVTFTGDPIIERATHALDLNDPAAWGAVRCDACRAHLGRIIEGSAIAPSGPAYSEPVPARLPAPGRGPGLVKARPDAAATPSQAKGGKRSA